MPTPTQLSFFDPATRYEALSHHGDPLEALAAQVPWTEVSSGLGKSSPPLQAPARRAALL